MAEIQEGDKVKITRVEITAGTAKDFIQFLADNIDKELPVIRAKNKHRGITVYASGMEEEFDVSELRKV